MGVGAYPHCSFTFEELNRYAVETKVGAKHRLINNRSIWC